MNVWILGYLAVLWGLHREKRCSLIADALAANWAVNQLIVMANGGWPVLPLFIFVDLATAVWLTAELGTQTARRTAKAFIPMIAFNGAMYTQSVLPDWHNPVLLFLAFAQAAVVAWGVWGDGLVEALDNPRFSVRVSLARAVHFFTRGH